MKPTPSETMAALCEMCAVMEKVSKMNQSELIAALANLDTYDFNSQQSAVFGEACHRLAYPITWRIRRSIPEETSVRQISAGTAVSDLAGALKKLALACYEADQQGDLPSEIDGSLLDAAKDALAAVGVSMLEPSVESSDGDL